MDKVPAIRRMETPPVSAGRSRAQAPGEVVRTFPDKLDCLALQSPPLVRSMPRVRVRQRGPVHFAQNSVSCNNQRVGNAGPARTRRDLCGGGAIGGVS